MGPVKVRPANVDDIPILLELLYVLGRPKPETKKELEEFKQLLQNYLSESDKKIHVAGIDDLVVGMISMNLLTRLNHTGSEMYVPELIVLEKYRRLGIGKKLIESCVEVAQSNNCHRIRLESGNHRRQSHQFYKNFGFDQNSLSFTLNGI